MRVLVCGSRTWKDMHPIHALLRGLYAAGRRDVETVLIHGACPRGADYLADAYGKRIGFAIEPYPADWDRYDKAAGHIRNQQMLDEGKPDVVWAFRSAGKSNGTDDMVRRAKAADVPTYVVSAA